MRKIVVIILGILFVHFSTATAQNKKIRNDKKKTHVTYYMSHPMHDWSGTSKEINSIILYNPAEGKIIQAAVSIKIASFDSQNANRDSHMLEVLESLKYPTVTFQSSEIKINGGSAHVKGMLTFHGVKKNIEFDAKLSKSNSELIVSGEFVVKMSEYNIESPTLMMIPVDDDIKVYFEAYYNLN